MNVEIGTETAQFTEKKYMNGIFVEVLLGVAFMIQRLLKFLGSGV